MSWLSDASANRIVQSYINNFMDVSGNFKVRNDVTSYVDNGPISWSQVGSDIDGEAANDQFGWALSSSSDGSIVAIGAPQNGGNGTNAGHVRVYQYANSTWTKLGQDIDGEAAGDYSGITTSISSDGSIVAIGAYRNANIRGHVRVYQYANSTWTQLGQDIDGEAVNDFFGTSVALSSDGTIVAIGAQLNDGTSGNVNDNRGHVRVYKYVNSTWTQLGQDIDGEASADYSGIFTAISSDGSIVAIGAHLNDGTGDLAGHVRVYQYANSTWTQMGQDLDGEAAGDFFGLSVSLSSDGSIVAAGGRRNDGTTGNVNDNRGHVRVYQWNGSTWTQMGQDIDGEAAGDESGDSVALSSDGSILAIGAYKNDGVNGTDSGQVRVYKYSNSTWTQLGADIDGEAASDFAGRSNVALSSDGSRVFVGAYGNDATGSMAGHVRVYDMVGGITTTTTMVEVLDISGGIVTMLSNTMDISSGVVDISGTTWMNRGQSGASIASAYQKGLVIESSSTSSGEAVLHIETAGQTQAFSVRANGDIYADNVLSHSSDDRRKINEQYITNAMETIKKLSPQIYTKLNDFVENGGTPTKTESGLIAQEIYYNAPELRHLVYIYGEPQPYDLSGNDIQNDPDYTALGWGNKSASVNYIGLIPYLIKANQEKQAILDEQDATIEQQTSQVEELKARLSSLESK